MIKQHLITIIIILDIIDDIKIIYDYKMTGMPLVSIYFKEKDVNPFAFFTKRVLSEYIDSCEEEYIRDVLAPLKKEDLERILDWYLTKTKKYENKKNV